MSVEGRACPRCRAALVERVNAASGTAFWGCSEWPECDFAMPIPTDELMRRAGATQLPGFD